MAHSGYRWSGREATPQYLTGTDQLILFHSINGECGELTLISDPTEEKGVYSVPCKYTFKTVFVNSIYINKNLLNPNIFRMEIHF